MITIKRTDIESYEHLKRVNIINSISGYKSANLIGTTDKSGQTNLAIFSSVTHFGSAPPLLGMVTRPTSVSRHTYDNIHEMGYYTINHIHTEYTPQAHQTSARYNKEQSEFEYCGLTPYFGESHSAPYVRESNISIGMKYVEEYEIKANGTILIIGEIQEILMQDNYIDENGDIDLEKAKTACISGLDCYYKPSKIGQYPYAKPKL